MSQETQVTLENESRPYTKIGKVEAVHTEEVLEYINNPENLEIMRDYDGKGEKSAKVGNQVVTVWIYLKIEGNVIRRATYFSDSLGGLIHAYGSSLTEVVKGKTIREALWLHPNDISANLGLPETGFGAWYKAALVEAINNYKVYEQKY